MKAILLPLLSIFFTVQLFAQTNYDAQWKKIDELIEKKNLPKSALAEVKKVYSLAKKQKNEAQIIKSLIYMNGLQEDTREDNGIESIKDIEKELPTAKEPALSILKSLLANLYWNYFSNNRYNLYERTNTTNFSKTDIATWGIEDFHRKITELFLQSLKNETLLKQTKLEPYDAIIQKGNLRYLRPTLYDLLAHNALDYFENDESDLKKPSYAFEINQPEAFLPAAQFVNYKFKTRDSLSLQHKALLIYQDLTAFHLNDAKPDALIDVEIERIEFVHNKATMENKEDLYKNALEQIAAKYPSNAIAVRASYLLARYYYDLASTYDPQKDTTHRYDRVTAKNILEKIVRDSAVKTQAWAESYNLLKNINDKAVSFTLEKVNIPDQAFRALIKYTNVTSLNLRLIKATNAMKEKSHNDDEKYWDAMVQASPVRTWTQLLPATNDYQQHSVEIKIDGLPVGEYILLASYDAKFDKKNKTLREQLFYVSNISYINKEQEFFVLHRETGQPLANATVQVWQQQYDNKSSSYVKKKLDQYKADANGYFKLKNKPDEYSYSYFYEINYSNDHLFMNEPIYGINFDRYIEPDTSGEKTFREKHTYIYLFTDRSIYRPGQTVYFKGITIAKTKSLKSEVRSDFKSTIYLRDANSQKIDSLKITTNEYGSFSGKFQLPSSALNGNFYLAMKDERGMETFRVEEYKRPKFYVEFDKIKKTYKANDTINVTGTAKAYAGNNIDGAKVSYRVVRQARFLYDWLRWWGPSGQNMEITHGEVATDAAGKFSIDFAAIPDRTIKKETEPVFDYIVYADVTDINGETRSSQKTITAGYKSLVLTVAVPEKSPVDSFKTISVQTENMNGEFQASTVSVSIFKLIPEQRLIRQRFWERPDQFVMSKSEFISYFPHDEYSNESDFKNWQRGENVYSKSDSSRVSGEWSVVSNDFPEGYYAIEITTKDKDGQDVKDIKYIELFDPNSKSLYHPEYLWTKGSKAVEPGEKTTVQIGSSADIFLVRGKDQNSKVMYSFDKLAKEKKNFDFIPTEADRGGFGLNFFFVRDNRFYLFNDIIYVPWSNKDLKIEYQTFRDKTLPGSEEKWKVKISGYKNEQATAEMLASMYDASLDQFYPHQWNEPNIWPVYGAYVNWNAPNFSSIVSDQRWDYDYDQRSVEWTYDDLAFDMESLVYENLRRRVIRGGTYKDISYLKVETSKFSPPVMKNGEVAQYRMMSKPVGDVSFGFSASNLSGRTNRSYDFYNTDTVAFLPENKNLNTDPSIQPRKNFNETAFFLPDLKTDADGTIEFSFKAPEALTRWKLQTLAHTKELAFGLSQKELVTQKQLMVQPNMPRFLRQGDPMELSVKIVNLSDSELTGQTQLELFDATTNQSVDGWFLNTFPNQYFTVAAGQSEVVKFPIQVPVQFTSALTWRVTARSGNFSDGEEDALPVLSNKVLVTETLPLAIKGTGTKTFRFEKLLNSGESETLQHQSLTIEYTSNPAWYAVQALPYLMEYPYECAEQTWNRFYANALASKIANSSPRIKEIFEKWKTKDTAALLSNLQKNQELKSALLEETPWVMDAKNEEQQKKNIALLFDMVRMSNELKSNLRKLKDLLNDNGSFPWFKGGYDDRYITQYILTGIGHLKKLGAIDKGLYDDLNEVVIDGLNYLDKKIKEDYDYLVKHKADLNKDQIGDLQIQYLYMRSFFSTDIPKASQTAFNFYKKQSQQFWRKQNKSLQGMIALFLNRMNDKQTAAAILKSLKEASITNEELGMYWKDNQFGSSWHWSSSPIETQSLMIEAFSEISNDTKTVDDLKTWLLKNKQTNNWRTTKATADACYAMFLQGTNLLTSEPLVQIKLGPVIAKNDNSNEAGTGYFKKTMSGDKIQPEMGLISVSVQPQTPNTQVQTSWGAAYWQYFEEMDKVTTATTPLQLNKKLFIERNTDRGPVLSPVEEGTELHVGDKIKVRIELRVDRDMEYVHMKDMRASALEPVNVLSGYKWQGGLGYYESTKDASTNFFFDQLRKGTYVFEYALFVTHTGSFSNGITSIQCMYAPEFSAHSEGIRISVE